MTATAQYKQALANEIVADYVQRFKPQVEPAPVTRNGQVIIILNGGIVIVKDDPEHQIVYSTNLNAMPQVIALEAAWIAKYHAGIIGEEHCQNPATGEIGEGAEGAMDMYMQVRIQEAKGLVAEMVEEAKANKEAETALEVDSPKIEL